MHQEPDTFVFILAGGSGERFWPLSRRATPKHLLRLLSEKTLLEETLDRAAPLTVGDHLFILVNHQQRAATLQALPRFPAAQLIAEPAKRDTAPAAALATAVAHARNPRAVVVLLPADHVIHHAAAFQQNLRDAARLAADGDALVTIAIPPARPATEFGYLRLGADVARPALSGGGTRFRRVERFVEKPPAATAAEYLASGQYAWNGGIFAWRADVFLREAARSAPALAAFIEHFPADRDRQAACIEREFPTLPKISVDYAIMEQAASVIAAQSTFDWDDAGSWSALAAHLPPDAADNIIRGAAVLHDARRNIIVSASGKPVALCGVNDLVVVETGDTVLVCHKDRAQEIKHLLPGLPNDLL
ncbi:MAG: NTP transferase domain-containing protein [Verrucomicrobiales bacterium]|jgi:mannose-1-phosphate guanylyltransferase|nr:NTP transferase domain-containing protein [Verrucomicrobiales bacterium]